MSFDETSFGPIAIQIRRGAEVLGYDPDSLTGHQRAIVEPAQYQELAARYNGGPYWEGDQAQAYGRGFGNHLENARDALR
ncbi:hypothetical protein [Streptomyces sp. ADI98-10]|uniref:hypothetical protein n=1 Tax=Streptomyces sp. ADI98-10 TaxID=1522763 RepID=UPI000F9BC515|nr:hypothetical protein [Streptomyces sp. ADI98-10]RPK89871.1 hypothetical protein EES46_14495 [Streptomyces sp. ADI98-10]